MFDSKYTNQSVYAKSTAVNIRKTPSTTSEIVLKKTGYMGRTSGAYLKMKDGIWFQINFDNPKTPSINQGYVRSDVVTFSEPKNNTVALNKAQDMINLLVESDKQIYTKLVKLAPIVKQLRATGSIDSNTLTLYKSLIQRLYLRQKAFIDSKLVEYKKGDLKGYEQEKQDFEDVYNAIGIIPIVVGIIVFVVIAATAGTICYYAFKPNYEDSKVDFVLSKQLDESLRKKLTTEEYSTLKTEGKKQIDDAYSAGKSEGKVGLVAKAAFFLGGFWLFDRYILSAKKGK